MIITDDYSTDRKIWSFVIAFSAIVLITSLGFIFTLFKNTQSVEAEVVAYKPQYKFDFVMSDTYDNKNCLLTYTYDNTNVNTEMTITKKHMNVGDTIQLLLYNDGSIVNPIILYFPMVMPIICIAIITVSIYNIKTKQKF